MERVIESDEKRLRKCKRWKGNNGKLLPIAKAQIHSVLFPKTVFLGLQGIPHQRRRRMKRGDERKKNTVCSMCEVHALDTACMCVKLWVHVMSWNRSVHTGLWDHMKLWVLLTRESCLGGIQCCMSISQTEWPLSSQKTIVSLHPYRLAPEGKTEQTWACTFKDRRWSNSPLISQGSWDCYILLGWLLKSQKLNARDWLCPTEKRKKILMPVLWGG